MIAIRSSLNPMLALQREFCLNHKLHHIIHLYIVALHNIVGSFLQISIYLIIKIVT